MIVIWNSLQGDTLGFSDVEAYFVWLSENPDWSYWDDQVHDVGAGGLTTPENQINLINRYNAL